MNKVRSKTRDFELELRNPHFCKAEENAQRRQCEALQDELQKPSHQRSATHDDWKVSLELASRAGTAGLRSTASARGFGASSSRLGLTA